jgi:hypothetical protein
MTMKEVGYQPQDITLAPIQEQLENLTRIGRAMRRIFKHKQAEKEEEDKEISPSKKPEEKRVEE